MSILEEKGTSFEREKKVVFWVHQCNFRQLFKEEGRGGVLQLNNSIQTLDYHI